MKTFSKIVGVLITVSAVFWIFFTLFLVFFEGLSGDDLFLFLIILLVSISALYYMFLHNYGFNLKVDIPRNKYKTILILMISTLGINTIVPTNYFYKTELKPFYQKIKFEKTIDRGSYVKEVKFGGKKMNEEIYQKINFEKTIDRGSYVKEVKFGGKKMNEEILLKLYNNAKVHFTMPSFEDFKADMEDEDKLSKFRKSMSIHYDIPDIATLKKDLGFESGKEDVVVKEIVVTNMNEEDFYVNNEEAFKDSYRFFLADGYNGTVEEYKNLINTNPEALKDAYRLFLDNGYNGDENEFRLLIGVQPGKEEVVVNTMSEEYIKGLYTNLGGEGKFGSYDNFVSVISTDEDYARGFYDNLGGESKFGKYEDFYSLVSDKQSKDLGKPKVVQEDAPVTAEYYKAINYSLKTKLVDGQLFCVLDIETADKSKIPMISSATIEFTDKDGFSLSSCKLSEFSWKEYKGVKYGLTSNNVVNYGYSLSLEDYSEISGWEVSIIE